VCAWDISSAQKAHYLCNDNAAANTTVADASGVGNTGTLAGGDNTSAKSTNPGKINRSLLHIYRNLKKMKKRLDL